MEEFLLAEVNVGVVGGIAVRFLSDRGRDIDRGAAGIERAEQGGQRRGSFEHRAAAIG